MEGLYPSEIENLPMYHPNIKRREEAFKYVLANNQGVGTFIVRPNGNCDPTFVVLTISVPGNEICHCRVYLKNIDGKTYYYISEKFLFKNFKFLLDHHKQHRIHCSENIDNIRLISPLYRRGSIVRPSDFVPVRRESLPSLMPMSPENLPPRNGQTHGMVQSGATAAVKNLSPSVSNSSLNSTGLSSRQLPDSFRNVAQQPTSGNNIPESRASVPNRPVKGGRASMPDIFNPMPPKQRSQSESQVAYTPKDYWICKPPQPLPEIAEAETDNTGVYYTRVLPNKNYLPEIISYLQETNMCECGLKIKDSRLPKGWTLHRSQDPQTLNGIFFQKNEEITTWEVPEEILPHLSREQEDMILYLCQVAHWPVPAALRAKVVEREGTKNFSCNQHSSYANTTPSSLSSTSSSSSSSSSSSTSALRLTSKQVTFSDQRQMAGRIPPSTSGNSLSSEVYERPNLPSSSPMREQTVLVPVQSSVDNREVRQMDRRSSENAIGKSQHGSLPKTSRLSHQITSGSTQSLPGRYSGATADPQAVVWLVAEEGPGSIADQSNVRSARQTSGKEPVYENESIKNGHQQTQQQQLQHKRKYHQQQY